MVEVDYNKIMDYSDELINYDSMLPLLVRTVIMSEWCNHLRSVGVYDEVINECILTKPHNDKEALKELTDWLKDNPKYKDMVK